MTTRNPETKSPEPGAGPVGQETQGGDPGARAGARATSGGGLAPGATNGELWGDVQADLE